jgi:hypothetical protein
VQRRRKQRKATGAVFRIAVALERKDMVKLEFYDPSGAIDVARPHAPRLDTLEGRRIGLLSNDQWQAYRTLPLLKELLEEDFPRIEVLPLDTFPSGQNVIGTDEVAQQVKRSGADAIIIGNAA